MSRNEATRTRLIERAADLIVDAFDDYNARFSDITRRAARHFDRCEWKAQQKSANQRISLYDQCIAETIDRLEHCMAERLLVRAIWLDIHQRYAERINERIDAELY